MRRKMKIAVEVIELTTTLYRARCVSLPGCTVIGQSREEVEKRIAVAIRAYLASLDVPVPRDVDVLAPCPERSQDKSMALVPGDI